MESKGWSGRPLLDIASYARKGPGERIQFSTAELDLIQRTASRTPEVMVKVLTKGGQNLKAAQRHLNYLSRNGDQAIHTDDGQAIQGKDSEARLLRDWDLDIEEHRRQSTLSPTNRRTPPKLVHKLIFSMPPGTAPDKVLQATQNFAREQFALKNRYAMVLHTDEPHPHVHLVLKAMSEDGTRLNIKKATLREWRSEFARHLRELGVAANATERAVRGQTKRSLSDGRYRMQQRGVSTHGVLLGIRANPEFGMSPTRIEIQRGWGVMANQLSEQGYHALATLSDGFNRGLKKSSDIQDHEPPQRAR